MDITKIKASNIRYSPQAMSLLGAIQDDKLDIDNFEKWFIEKSPQTVIGGATILDYLQLETEKFKKTLTL